ncbi:cell envelope integrity EipB family protein [Dichotomicrobium thermohalophilum]|uniref:Uncharacterized protein DUF1849 n=1 Tax=Dichotomicrobium thermohalophilum TaxID=933063 RepID=A0A397PIP8_9HYPH|nr:cell envelope integrity EipB family protein [Dichotomicrobium thermohalophilum]RIA47769.1 uncharacterized protein DUF1849 [Dichotomicrobium thermohalophilum]
MRSCEAKFGRLAGAAVVTAVAVTAASAPAQATGLGMPFAPHRAVYEMQLDETDAAKNIAGVEGRMVFDISGSRCTGYTLENRMVTRIVDAEGVEVVSDIRSSTWEASDGERFRFNSSQYLNNQLTDNLEGRAEREAPGGPITITLEAPRQTQMRIDEPAQFPTQFSLKILEAARAGERVIQTNVYDGSETGDKLFATTTFIGEAIPAGQDTGADVPGRDRLADKQSWPVSISYFEVGAADDSVPSYQLSFRLYENGVSRKLRIDYGSFALTGELSSLEFHKADACRQTPG